MQFTIVFLMGGGTYMHITHLNSYCLPSPFTLLISLCSFPSAKDLAPYFIFLFPIKYLLFWSLFVFGVTHVRKKHMIFKFVCLVYFTQHYISQVHPFSYKSLKCAILNSWVIPQYIDSILSLPNPLLIDMQAVPRT